MFIYIPFKILGYGWTPPDDANRHVAFSTIDAKWSDVLVIDEKFDTDHNAGWHQVLKFLYKYCGFDKLDLMFFSVVFLFFLVNICGLIISPTPIGWCIALLAMMNFDSGILSRMLLGRPYIISCAVTLVILRLWGIRPLKEEKNVFLQKSWARYLITIIAFTLGVWIHGTWYVFLLIPISFFIAGKNKEALQLAGCIIISTLMGAMLTGHFSQFLYYHFMATFTIYSEPTYNWLLVSENATGMQSIYWALFAALLAFLCARKNRFQLQDIAKDPVFIMVLLCWLGGILVIRCWVDWGRMALLVWMSYRISDLIDSSVSLKEPRVRYCLSAFVLTALLFCSINDSNGRYTKSVLVQPIDFYNEKTFDKLKGWEPEAGGIVYSNDTDVFYKHFYAYPEAKWKYVLGFESGIMKPEDKQALRNMGYSGLDDDYLPWINKMNHKDRLIISQSLKRFEQLEWVQGSRYYWIGRLKQATATADINSESSQQLPQL